jgi:hypothetical protein
MVQLKFVCAWCLFIEYNSTFVIRRGHTNVEHEDTKKKQDYGGGDSKPERWMHACRLSFRIIRLDQAFVEFISPLSTGNGLQMSFKEPMPC